MKKHTHGQGVNLVKSYAWTSYWIALKNPSGTNLHILNDHEHERQFYRARYQLIHDTYFARKFVEWRIRPSSFVNEYPIAYPTVVALTKSVNQAVDEHSALGEP